MKVGMPCKRCGTGQMFPNGDMYGPFVGCLHCGHVIHTQIELPKRQRRQQMNITHIRRWPLVPRKSMCGLDEMPMILVHSYESALAKKSFTFCEECLRLMKIHSAKAK